MCTVTFIPHANGFVLTSSRDEQKLRPTKAPQEYFEDNLTFIYPQDELAGGTWIAASSISRYACLLNGAFVNHKKKATYRKSRGKILLDSLKVPIDTFIDNVNLNDIEPFTLLLIDTLDGVYFKELIWDGVTKHTKQIDATIDHIWSSVTLYDESAIAQRNQWFNDWLVNNTEAIDKNSFLFHIQPHSEIAENDILMERDKGIQTVSITQIRHQDTACYMVYTDIVNQSQTSIPISEINTPDLT